MKIYYLFTSLLFAALLCVSCDNDDINTSSRPPVFESLTLTPNNVKAGENVKAVVAYSGFDNEPEMIKEFADRNLKKCKGLVAFLFSASQFILFPHRFFRSSWKCLKECGCRAMIIHGSADEEIADTSEE